MFLNLFRFIYGLFTRWAWKQLHWYVSWWDETQEGKQRPCKASFLDLSLGVQKENLLLSCFIKKMVFPFISTTFPILIVTYHLKDFMLQSAAKFFAFPGQLHTSLIWQHVLVFFGTDKKRIVNVLVSFDYFKRSLRNTSKHFIICG